MLKHMKYEHRFHSKGRLHVHLIFVTRFRKSCLVGKTADYCKQVLYEAAQEIWCTIVSMETDRDHVHILIQYPPTLNVSAIVKKLKQYSTHTLWKHYPAYLHKLYWDGKTFWSKGYFYCSIGEVSEKTIQHYIENHG